MFWDYRMMNKLYQSSNDALKNEWKASRGEKRVYSILTFFIFRTSIGSTLSGLFSVGCICLLERFCD